jgi:hypothetical protein
MKQEHVMKSVRLFTERVMPKFAETTAQAAE